MRKRVALWFWEEHVTWQMNWKAISLEIFPFWPAHIEIEEMK